MQPEGGPTPNLPPRLQRDLPVAGLPPRIERGSETALPPRIERAGEPKPAPPPASTPELPPRIEHPPEVAAEAPAEPAEEAAASMPPRPAIAVTDSPEPTYVPRHAREAAAEAETDAEPETEPVAATAATPVPIGPVRPDPLASPVKNTLRAHQRLAYILAAVIIIAGAGFWALRVHQRIGQHALEAGVL